MWAPVYVLWVLAVLGSASEEEKRGLLQGASFPDYTQQVSAVDIESLDRMLDEEGLCEESTSPHPTPLVENTYLSSMLPTSTQRRACLVTAQFVLDKASVLVGTVAAAGLVTTLVDQGLHGADFDHDIRERAFVCTISACALSVLGEFIEQATGTRRDRSVVESLARVLQQRLA